MQASRALETGIDAALSMRLGADYTFPRSSDSTNSRDIGSYDRYKTVGMTYLELIGAIIDVARQRCRI